MTEQVVTLYSTLENALQQGEIPPERKQMCREFLQYMLVDSGKAILGLIRNIHPQTVDLVAALIYVACNSSKFRLTIQRAGSLTGVSEVSTVEQTATALRPLFARFLPTYYSKVGAVDGWYSLAFGSRYLCGLCGRLLTYNLQRKFSVEYEGKVYWFTEGFTIPMVLEVFGLKYALFEETGSLNIAHTLQSHQSYRLINGTLCVPLCCGRYALCFKPIHPSPHSFFFVFLECFFVCTFTPLSLSPLHIRIPPTFK